ncbi:MAG: isopeptide-forming domain-containing fimbrial protein [Clostridiales bacterium]|nr:isopeptide-forming domain-containing fimbrial protein [Clostridiales bacterium]
MSMFAFALADNVTISVARHGSYDADAAGTRDYTWYRVFTASYDSNTSTGGGVTEGTVGAVTGTADAAAYTANSTVAAKLGQWVAASGSTAAHWERATGNEWFDLTPIAGTTNYSVTWVGESTAARAAAAAAWLLSKEAYEATGTLTFDSSDNKWKDTVTAGYYLIAGSEGANLVAATTNIEITEKDTYPTIDKKQKKENGTWTDDPLPQEIGKVIEYKVEIPVPADANKSIAVVDKMSAGLTWDETFGTNGLTVTPATATYTALPSTHPRYNAENTWQILFSDSVITALAGQTITITYQATVNANALTDTDKENEVTLDYNNGHYWVPDEVKYETYFGGIYKVDPSDATADLSGVKFVLKDGDGNAVNVTYDSTNGYYKVDASSTSNEVQTRADGSNYTIKIRGLDGNKTYTLTETENPHPGYNLLAEPATLTLTKDEGTAFADKAANTYDRVENSKGNLLPSTGGIGTTLFYVGGGILVLLAVVMLVTKRRMSGND